MAIYKEDIVNIDLKTGNIHRSFLNRAIGMTDNAADHFGVRVFRGNTPVDLTGVSVQGYFRDPHGNNIAITTGNIVNGNVAVVVLPQACYNYDGQFCLAIKLVGGGVTGTMRIVDGVVDNTNTSGAVAPTGTVPTYQEILSLYDEMVDATGEANRSNEMIINTANKVGYFHTQFSATAGTGHSSSDDKLSVSIKQGQIFTVNVSGGITQDQIYAYYSDGTSTMLTGAYLTYKGTAAKDIIAIGVYLLGSWVPEDTIITITAQIEGSLNVVVPEIRNEMDTQESLVGYFENSFSATAGTGHSSSNDQVKVIIKQGQTFTVQVTGDITQDQIIAYYSDGTYATLTGVYLTYKGTAAKDIIAIGIYLEGSWVTANTTIKTKVIVQDSIYSKVYGSGNADGMIGYYENKFDVTAGTSHSSDADRMDIFIRKGDQFTFIASGNITRCAFYWKYSDGTTGSETSSTHRCSGNAVKDIVQLGVFIDGSYILENQTITVVAYSSTSMYGITRVADRAKAVSTTVLGAIVPEDLTEYCVTASYAAAMKAAINAWMAEYAGDDTKIPIIVHTDQHGRLETGRKGLFDLMTYLVNWDEVSAIFDLGDTITDTWTDDNTNTNPLLRNGVLESAMVCLSSVPKDKQINIYGNHDTWYSGNETTTVAGVLPSLKYLNPYFKSWLRAIKCQDNSGNMIVYDDEKKIKYLVIGSWDYAAKSSPLYTDFWISQSHLEWIIAEMEKSEGYDLVLVSHVPLAMDEAGSINPISGADIEKPTKTYITTGDNYLVQLWNARKNKQSGTISHAGISVTYDFTQVTDDVLCAIAGHTHYDGVEYLGNANDGLLQVAFDWFDDDTIHFFLIDRTSRNVKCWKLHNESRTPGVQTWEMPLDRAQ